MHLMWVLPPRSAPEQGRGRRSKVQTFRRRDPALEERGLQQEAAT
jgi:hypothetical protein